MINNKLVRVDGVNRVKQTRTYTRHRGKFATKLGKTGLVVGGMGIFVFLIFNISFDKWYSNEVHVAIPHIETVKKVSADETAQAMAFKTINQLKKEMVDSICNKERAGHIQKAGELFMTFDPAKQDYQECIQIGGVMPQKCLSYGECQIKVTMLMNYYPKTYGKQISEKDAFNLTQDPVASRQFTEDCSIKVAGCALNWTTVNNNITYFNTVLPIIRHGVGL